MGKSQTFALDLHTVYHGIAHSIVGIRPQYFTHLQINAHLSDAVIPVQTVFLKTPEMYTGEV